VIFFNSSHLPNFCIKTAMFSTFSNHKALNFPKIINNNKMVGFEVLTAVSTKMAVFWVVAPCSLVDVYRRFRGPCFLHHQGRPDDGDSKDLWDIGTHLPDHTALQPRRQSFW
jgi:hypothetical protein